MIFGVRLRQTQEIFGGLGQIVLGSLLADFHSAAGHTVSGMLGLVAHRMYSVFGGWSGLGFGGHGVKLLEGCPPVRRLTLGESSPHATGCEPRCQVRSTWL